MHIYYSWAQCLTLTSLQGGSAFKQMLFFSSQVSREKVSALLTDFHSSPQNQATLYNNALKTNKISRMLFADNKGRFQTWPKYLTLHPGLILGLVGGGAYYSTL